MLAWVVIQFARGIVSRSVSGESQLRPSLTLRSFDATLAPEYFSQTVSPPSLVHGLEAGCVGDYATAMVGTTWSKWESATGTLGHE